MWCIRYVNVLHEMDRNLNIAPKMSHMVCLSVILLYYIIICLWFCNKNILCNKRGVICAGVSILWEGGGSGGMVWQEGDHKSKNIIELSIVFILIWYSWSFWLAFSFCLSASVSLSLRFEYLLNLNVLSCTDLISIILAF